MFLHEKPLEKPSKIKKFHIFIQKSAPGMKSLIVFVWPTNSLINLWMVWTSHWMNPSDSLFLFIIMILHGSALIIPHFNLIRFSLIFSFPVSLTSVSIVGPANMGNWPNRMPWLLNSRHNHIPDKCSIRASQVLSSSSSTFSSSLVLGHRPSISGIGQVIKYT